MDKKEQTKYSHKNFDMKTKGYTNLDVEIDKDKGHDKKEYEGIVTTFIKPMSIDQTRVKFRIKAQKICSTIKEDIWCMSTSS